jgi:ribosomal protein L40E
MTTETDLTQTEPARKNKQYCPECGHENPGEARFCMDCGYSLGGEPAANAARRPTAESRSRDSGPDWAGIAAAVLAFLSLRHMSRKARDTTIVLAFLLLFFGCPMACGFAMFVVDSVVKLFQ